MDVSEMAKEINEFLVPFLPYLVIVGEKAAGEAGKKLSGAAWEQAQSIWARLRGHDRVEQAAGDVVDEPQDQGAQAALRYQIKKLLESDEVLCREMAELWEETERRVGGDTINMIVNVRDQAQVRDIIFKQEVRGEE